MGMKKETEEIIDDIISDARKMANNLWLTGTATIEIQYLNGVEMEAEVRTAAKMLVKKAKNSQ